MVKKVLVRFFSRLYSDEVFGYAAQISYYLLLSLFPFLVLLTYVLAKTQTLNLEQILQYLLDYDLAPAAAIEVMESVIEDLRIPTGMLSFYVIVVLWCASRGIRAIMNGIHMAFRTHEPRGIVVSFLRSFFYTLAFAVILISYMLLVLFGDLIFSWLIRTFHLAILGNHVFSLIRYLFPIVLMYVIYILLYRSVPAKRLRFKDVRFGALIATLLSFATSKIFSFYTANFANYSALYGSLSGIIIICTWMYLFSMILIMGAELTAVLCEIRAEDTFPPPSTPATP